MGLGDKNQWVQCLVSGLRWQTMVFHVGQHCGRWEASTSGRSLASFHLVMDGECHLHLPGGESVRLGPRDGVFLLRDLPHHLSDRADPTDRCGPKAMHDMLPRQAGGAALACGFFQFEGPFTERLLADFPPYLILRSGDPTLQKLAPLFELMLAEAPEGGGSPSPLIERLVDLLFFYVIRQFASDGGARGVWGLASQPALAPLVARLMAQPGHPWTVEEMAQLVNLSRARFFREFSEASGQAPAQYLLELRMRTAAQCLLDGDSVARTAEHVGYQSYASFAKAFKRVTGVQPGAFQREGRGEGRLGSRAH